MAFLQTRHDRLWRTGGAHRHDGGRRGWLTREQFIDLVGATNLIPGPNSTEMAIHIGHSRAGCPGLLVAGASFILPASLIVTACAWAYVRFGGLPQVDGILYGAKPVIIAIVLQALAGLGRAAVKTPSLAVAGIAAAAFSILGVNELLLLFAAGLLIAAIQAVAAKPRLGSSTGIAVAFAPPASTSAAVGAGVAAGAATAITLPFGLWPMFLCFLLLFFRA